MMKRGVGVMMLAAACTGGGETSPDAANAIDAASDASHDAPTTGAIQVQVYDSSGNAAANVDVGFVLGSGSQLDVMTDANGIASVVGGSGTSATIHGPEAFRVMTFAGLGPGAKAVWGAPRMDDNTPGGPPLKVTFPSYANATYFINGSCNLQTQWPDDGSAGTVTVPVGIQPCSKQKDADIVVYAVDAAGHLGYSAKQHVDFTVGDFSLPALQPGAAVTVSATGFTADVNGADVQLIGRDSSDPVARLGYVDLDGLGTPHPQIAPVGDTLEVYGSFAAVKAAYHARVPFDPHVVIDGTQAPRQASDAAIAGNKITWTESGAGADPTLVVVRLQLLENGPNDSWIIAPYTGPSLTVPALALPSDSVITSLSFYGYPGVSYLDALPAFQTPVWAVGVK